MATILIVDDLAANRTFLVTLLRHHGHHLLEAADGSEGLTAARTGRPDLVITDVLMPVMDGYDLVRQLRLDAATSGIPVVFYTAHYGEREARALAESNGVSYVLTKPAQSAAVLDVVARALARDSNRISSTDVSPLAAEFDREHLRLLTDKLSEKTGELRAANARLRALINIGLELASEGDSNRLFQSVCVAARDLFGATYVTLGIVDQVERTVRHFLVCGADATCQASAASWVKTGDAPSGILATVVAERRTLRGTNTGGNPASLQLPATHPEIRAFLAAPIASPLQVYGWICLVANEGKAFTDDEENLMAALGGQIGRVYEHNQLHALMQSRADQLEREILDRKRTEVRLIASIKDTVDLREAINQHAMVTVTDPNGKITSANNKVCQVSGYPLEALVGQDHRILNSGYHSPEFMRDLWTTIQKGNVWHGEIRNRARDGTLYWVDTTIVPFLKDDGTPRQYMAIRTVITERKEAELALRDERDQAQRYLDTAEVILLKLDLEGRILLVNRYACSMLGWSAEELLGRDWIDTCLPERIRKDLRGRLQDILTGDLSIAENPILTRSGEERLIEWRNRLVRDEAGRIVGVFSSGTDITHRTQAIEAVRTAEERTRFALESANVGIWDMDYATGVVRWSEVLEAQYGVQPGTFAGTFEAFIERIHPDDRQSALQTIGQAVTSGNDFSVSTRSIWPDGSVHLLSGAGRFHLGPDGTPVRGVGISMDVTERRALEEQYQQAQKMEAMGRLAGGVAHDFNNLLTGILGYCELLLADLDPEDSRQADIAEIQKAGASAAALTRQLLAFSRKEIIEPTVLNLNTVVAGMQVMLQRVIGEDVTVQFGLAADLWDVKADHGQLEQIIMNLSVNARDAMPMGGRLTIETANVELDGHYAKAHVSVEPGRYVALTVSDSGSGMSPEVQSRLFEPFFTTKEQGRGTGLGLATVHGIVKRSGGSVNVYSEPGKGSSFKVYLPRVDHVETLASPPAVRLPPSDATETVLVVEDADGLRRLTRRLLQRQGFTVLVAANAEEALELFEQNRHIDVLLTDVVMPGASGPELTRQLVERRPGLKVLYMSGYTEDAIVHHGILDPGIAFLHKPFTSESLGRKLREVLDRDRQQR